MTDERYVLTQINRERKILGYSAKHRVCGSKTRYVSLPSDHLTPSELKRRNGEMKTYKLGERMNWNTFKAMPSTLRLSYLEFMKNGLGMNMTEIADALGVNRNTIRFHIRDYNLGIDFPRGKYRRTPAQAARYNAFMAGENVASSYPTGGFEPADPDPAEDISNAPETAQIDLCADEPEPVEIPTDNAPAQTCAFLPPRAGSLEYTGTPALVMDAIYRLLPDGVYDFTLSFQRKN